MWKAGIVSQGSKEQYDRLCLSPEITGTSCVPDIIELIEPSDIVFIAEKIQANAAFVSKLLDREIIVGTIPVSLLSLMGGEFGVPYEHLYEYLKSGSDIQASDNSNIQKKSPVIKNSQTSEEAV